MQDRELYQQILGLHSPWSVGAIQLDVQRRRVGVVVEHPEGTRFECPECGCSLACYDHVPEREWRHLDTMQFQTILKARVPRVNCPEHGVKQVHVPWAEKGSHLTLLFERLAIDVLLATQTVTGAMAILGTKWDQTWGIVQRAVARGRTGNSRCACRASGSMRKPLPSGTRTSRCWTTSTAARSRRSATATTPRVAWPVLPSCRTSSFSPAYVSAAKQVIPLAEEKIVHDRFHVMQLATRAVDQVRRAEHRELLAHGDDRLSKTKYVWITSQEQLSEKQQALFDETYTLQLRTGKAWAFKEMLRDLWTQPDTSSATGYFQAWYQRVTHARMEPLKQVARTIKERLRNVVSYCTHGITNAVAEGLNSKIMAIKRRVGGYRNREHFKTAILFHCGGLSLSPQ